MKIYNEDFSLDFNNNSQLSFKDYCTAYVQLYLDDKFVGNLEVWTDRGNDNKEYIIINHEIIYLNDLKLLVSL